MPPLNLCFGNCSIVSLRATWDGSILVSWKMSWAELDDSIAAYRKSVAAKPDVFESNLNLGLQLAKTGQPEAEQFLRAATQLKPTATRPRVNTGPGFLWGRRSKNRSPKRRSRHTSTRQRCNRKRLSRILPRGNFSNRKTSSPKLNGNTKQALALDSRSTDAVMGLANIYMRGRRFPEAEEYLRKLLAANREFGCGAHPVGARARGREQDRRRRRGTAGRSEAGTG